MKIPVALNLLNLEKTTEDRAFVSHHVGAYSAG